MLRAVLQRPLKMKECAAYGRRAKRYAYSVRTLANLPSLREAADDEPSFRDRFVEDEGWHRAAERYENFLRTRDSQRILFLELGVGYNTPVIIKYPFWHMTAKNPNAVYACINYGDAIVPEEIASQSICINADIGEVLKQL